MLPSIYLWRKWGKLQKSVLDKDLKKLTSLEGAGVHGASGLMNMGLALLFLMVVFAVSVLEFGVGPKGIIIVIASVLGGYMAMNIGANDVANNVAPAVGAKALTLTGALIIAAICEASGAILAGGDVVATVSKSIVAPELLPDTRSFIWAMMAALFASAIWVNLATFVGAPVSTTHAVVGGILGAGIAAAGWGTVNWPVMAQIAMSWVISPVMGGVIAAGILYFIKKTILYQENRVLAAQKWVPVLLGLMAGAFTIYLIMKGLKHIWRPELTLVLTIGGLVFLLIFIIMRLSLKRLPFDYPNNRKAIARLFVVPLILSAAMLSFAHGANDVANAIGPLAAIVSVVEGADIASDVQIPFGVMLVGALGISAGLVLFGPKLIRTVGENITKLDPIRAFAVAISASVTVIFASGLGLPVSSTHIAVGGVFGVGFLREYLSGRRIVPVVQNLENLPEKQLKKLKKRRLVRRIHLFKIIAAWVITVPLAGLLSAFLYFVSNNISYLK